MMACCLDLVYHVVSLVMFLLLFVVRIVFVPFLAVHSCCRVYCFVLVRRYVYVCIEFAVLHVAICIVCVVCYRIYMWLLCLPLVVKCLRCLINLLCFI